MSWRVPKGNKNCDWMSPWTHNFRQGKKLVLKYNLLEEGYLWAADKIIPHTPPNPKCPVSNAGFRVGTFGMADIDRTLS